MLKKNNPHFVSDILVILESAGALLNIIDSTDGKYSARQFTLVDFLAANNLNSYLIYSMVLPSYDPILCQIKVFKVMPRSQNANAYVNCGFRFKFKPDSIELDGKPTLAFNGIAPDLFHTFETENYLSDKNLNDDNVVKTAFAILNNELNDTRLADNPLEASFDYRINAAMGFFYKFVLALRKDSVSEECKSAISSLSDDRVVSHAEQQFQTNSELYPLTQAVPKLNCFSQVTGETKYVDDMFFAGGGFGYFILSTIANGKIESINVNKAKNLPGVLGIFFANDIPGIKCTHIQFKSIH